MARYKSYYLELKTHHLNVPYLGRNRRVRVLLPRGYYNSSEHYPVVYFHDGQNIFYSKEAFSGHSWKIIPTIKNNDFPPMIIVGIDNDGYNRMNEYTAWPFINYQRPEDGPIGGYANEYGEFVMDVVKPFVDSHYRTKPDRKHTAMVGSSLGGNITAYLGLKYQDQIGNLGVFSLANWTSQDEFNEYISCFQIDPTTKVYIQVGTHEGDATDRQFIQGSMRQAYIDTTLMYYESLIRQGLHVDNIELNIFADEKHTEVAWAKHLSKCLGFFSWDWR